MLARFTATDPLVQAPYDLQSLNRYSYVFNNPLGYTDPSGYEGINNNEITISDRRWQAGGASPSQVYTYGSFGGSGNPLPFSSGRLYQPIR